MGREIRYGLASAIQDGSITGAKLATGAIDNTKVSSTANIETYKLAGGVWGGSGADGDVILSVNTTLTRDMYYNNLTINNGVTLYPANFRIFVKGTLTNNGTINGDGANASGPTAGTPTPTGTLGTVAAGGNGGASGANGTNGVGSSPSAAGNTGATGGASGGGATVGGTGGVVTLTTKNPISNILNAMQMLEIAVGTTPVRLLTGGASGGGGGGWSPSGPFTCGAGGGAGAIASTIVIFCKVLAGTGSITANGGVGGVGGSGGTYACNGAGGGAGGNGGLIILGYSSKTITGSITANGGVGGVGGTKEASGTANGANGANGASGNIIEFVY